MRTSVPAHLARATALLGVAAVLTACGFSLTGRPAPPTGIAASTTEPGRIVVTWSPVPGAGVYYVYRALSAEGPWGEPGPFGPVPYRTVIDPELVDTDVDPITYYYRVSAGDPTGQTESGLSAVVEGRSSAEELSWQGASLIELGSSTLVTAVDYYSDTARGYVVSVAEENPATPDIRRMGAGGTVSTLADPEIGVDGTRRGRASVTAADDVVYLAAVNAATDVPSVWRYTTDSAGWVLWSEGLPAAHASAPQLQVASSGVDAVYLAYRAADGSLASFYLDGSTTPLTGPAETPDSNLELAAIGDAVYVAFETASTTLYASRLDGTTWGTPEVLAADSGVDADVAADELFDVTVEPVTGDLYAAYYSPDEKKIRLVTWNGNGTSVLMAPAPGTPAPPAETVPDAGPAANVGLAADPNSLYLFSVDTDGAEEPTLSTVIRRYQFSRDTWDLTAFSPDGFTAGGDPATLALAARNQIVYAGYIDASVSAVRTYR